jgi:hypothetical protein
LVYGFDLFVEFFDLGVCSIEDRILDVDTERFNADVVNIMAFVENHDAVVLEFCTDDVRNFGVQHV